MSEQLRWYVRTSGTGGAVDAFVRKHQFKVGPPISYDIEEGSITALEYALGGIAAELVGGLFASARHQRVKLDGAEALIAAEINDPMAQIGGPGATGHPGLELLEIWIYVSTLEDDHTIVKLWESVLSRSTLLHTLRRATKVEIKLEIT